MIDKLPIRHDKRTNTYQHNHDEHIVETVVGDDKQADFHPRLKIKKWHNEVNFSIGLDHTGGKHEIDGEIIHYHAGDKHVRFYPRKPKVPQLDKKTIRYINAGSLDPTTIAAQYELDRHVEWPSQTIVNYYCDRPAMMYYGYYLAETYIDKLKIDLPEIRLSSIGMQNNPMYMDKGLPLIYIHYDRRRDDTDRIHSLMVKAVTQVLGGYGIPVEQNGLKLYFKHVGKKVKFFSTALIDNGGAGQYYFYFNLACDYNKAYDYYRSDIRKEIRDKYAYGLKAIKPDLPDSVVEEIITRYAKLYGATLKQKSYTKDEWAIINKLKPIMESRDWIDNAKRDDVYLISAADERDGFEFDVELTTKPANNIMPLTIKAKGLVFYYQPELTPEERLKSVRPPDVVGSYAVYHESKMHDHYKTGKAFHIHRPYATDAEGNQVWCELDLDLGNEKLNIIIPPEFLDQAVYPIVIDPYFGYTTLGATAADSSNAIKGIQATSLSSTSGLVYRIVVGKSSSATGQKAAIYDNSSNKVVGSKETTDTSTIKTWWQFTPVSAVSLSANTNYYLVYWTSAQAYAGIWFDTGAGVTVAQTYVAGDDGFPASLTFTTDSNRYSIYVVYDWARLDTHGFELNSVTANMEFEDVQGSPTISSTTVRSGTYAGRISSLVSLTRQGFCTQFVATAASGPYYFRAYFRYATAPSANNTILAGTVTASVSGTQAWAIKLSSTGTLTLFNAATQVGSASSALTANTWYRVEVQFDATPAAGSQILNARLNDVQFAGASNLTITNTTIMGFVVGGNLNAEAQTTGDWFFDDLAVNYGDWVGDGKVIVLRPNAAGDSTQWTLGAGTANWQAVSETPPDDITTYVYSVTANNIDHYKFGASGMGALDKVNVVDINARFSQSVADTTMTFRMELEKTASSTVGFNAPYINPNSTTWRTNATANPMLPIMTSYFDPTGSAWLQSTIDTLQAGQQLQVASGTHRIRITAVWVTVDYTPAAPRGGDFFALFD